MDTFRLIKRSRGSGFYHMAVDEAVLLSLKQGKGAPTVRFYRFEPVCLSIGFFQKATREIDLIACRALGVDVVRRPTGGRGVLHRGDLTYSVVASTEGPTFSSHFLDSYRKISLAIVEGLKELDLQAHLVSGKDKERAGSSPHCFSSPSLYEVVVASKKIAGSAQRRDDPFFLQHGSIFIDLPEEKYWGVFPDRDFSKITCVNHHVRRKVTFSRLEQALAASFQRILEVKLVEEGLTDDEEDVAERLCGEKYLRPDWNFGR